MTDRPRNDARVLLLAPTMKDATASATLLEQEGFSCTTCRDLPEVCQQFAAGAGAIVLPEETILHGRGLDLAKALNQQPNWSNVPVIVLTSAGPDSALKVKAILELGDVTLLKRPLEFSTFVNAVRAALRDRERQYLVRDHLAERKAVEQVLMEKDERLHFALAAGRLGAWEVDMEAGVLECSDICKGNYGRAPGTPFTYSDLFQTIHPEDRAGVRTAVSQAKSEGKSFDIEYRIVWPGGEIHWILVRGRPTGGAKMTGVSLDVTERKLAEEAVRDADRKKDDFIALLAHELRNPLAPIRNGLQVLRLADNDSRAVHGAREMMDRQLAHMVRLVDDLLDISRIGRNKMELRRERISLKDAIAAAVETARPMIDAANHELHISVPPEPIHVDGDLTRLSQVFSNLLTNSAKYTPPGGHITLKVECHGREVWVAVQDDGIGIPHESIDHIFDMFSQVDRSIERSTGGLGIGLALVKGLVEMHGGSVSAWSDGGGSTFTVRLPLLGRETQLAAPTSVPQGRSQRRILVVDDNQDGADSLAMMLQLLGDDVRTAHDGIQAVQEAERFLPQVILMDVGMPRMNGLDATRKIREQSWGKEITIYALTGWGQAGDRENSRLAGCNGHLVKPVYLPDLEKALAWDG